MLLRDKDANTAEEDAADNTPEQRYYYGQNWRGDVVAIFKADGSQVLEWIKYLAYGRPDLHPFSDSDNNGTVAPADSGAYNSMYTAAGSTYFVRADTNLSGTITSGDLTQNSTDLNSWPNAGVDQLSRTDATFNIGNRIGYAGMQWDPVIKKYLARYRWLDPENGVWLSRDPKGYVSTPPALYAYVNLGPVAAKDPSGLDPDHWSNWDFVKYYFRTGGSRNDVVDLGSIGLLEDYKAHPAIAKRVNRLRDKVENIGRMRMYDMMRELNCVSGPWWRGTDDAYGTIQDPVGRDEFVQVSFADLLIVGPVSAAFNFWMEDWTFSIGGHRFKVDYDCITYAKCGPCDRSPNRMKKFGMFSCEMIFSMDDVFTDPLDWREKIGPIYSPIIFGGLDVMRQLFMDNEGNLLSGTSFKIHGDWRDSVSGDASDCGATSSSDVWGPP